MEYNNINKIRKEKGITLAKLSDLSGVSIGYICHLENGTRKNPSLEKMQKIADALNKTILNNKTYFKTNDVNELMY